MPPLPPILVLVGGPLGGKSTSEKAIELEFGRQGKVHFVDEAATVLLSDALFPRPDPLAGEPKRHWLFHFQIALAGAMTMVEHAARKFARLRGEIDLIVCDRGLPDIWAYLDAKDHRAIEAILGCTLERALGRYTAVLFLETLAASKPELYEKLAANNSVRNETVAEACAIDALTRDIWSRHPRFHAIDGVRSVEEQSRETIRFCGELLAH